MAVQLRSGKELSSSGAEKKEKTEQEEEEETGRENRDQFIVEYRI